MKKKISFKLFFTVMWRGVCQVCNYVARLFGYRGASSYSKVVWRIFAGCVTFLLLMYTTVFLYELGVNVIYRSYIEPKMNPVISERVNISSRIEFQSMNYGEYGRVYDNKNKEVMYEDIDWVVTSDDDDSLAVFSQYGKRGYMNRYNGKIEIPLSFSKAWVFSEGLAAVIKDGRLVFIDHSGNVVIDKDIIAADDCYLDFVFRNGFCIIKDAVTNKWGLLDRSGEWKLKPEYDFIFNSYGFWKVEKDGMSGLYSADMKVLYPLIYNEIYIYDNIIEVRMRDNTAKRYDFEGNVVVDFVIDDVENLMYETDNLREDKMSEEGDFDDLKIYGVATCMSYRVNNGLDQDFYGLIDRDGKRITQPLYTSIEAVSKDVYLCMPDGILLNSRGRLIR